MGHVVTLEQEVRFEKLWTRVYIISALVLVALAVKAWQYIEWKRKQ